jgi:hypothetical protein
MDEATCSINKNAEQKVPIVFQIPVHVHANTVLMTMIFRPLLAF